MTERSTERALEFNCLRHLIVVAGPSGCGKSTFVKFLDSETCDPEIRAALPHGAEKAPSIDEKYPDRLHGVQTRIANGRAIFENPTVENTWNAPVIILHYALNRLASKEISRLSDEHILLHFVRQAKQSVTIINVRPNNKELAINYANRSFGETKMRNALWWIFSRISKMSKLIMYIKYRYFFAGSRLCLTTLSAWLLKAFHRGNSGT